MAEDPNDPFSRANYRSLIAWPARIRREAPFLARALSDLPDRSVADLGCGTGEHSRHLASQGFRVAGLDLSETMIADAVKSPLPPNLSFHLGDLREADRILGSGFGAALILGNTIAFFLEASDLERCLGASSRVLAPGGRILIQMLNYQGLYERGERNLPLNFNDQEEGTIVFLRLLDLRESGKVLFFPTTLRFRPDGDPPLELVRVRRVEQRAWSAGELLPALEAAGFADVETFGDMEGGRYDPHQSRDLVLLARKSRSPA